MRTATACAALLSALVFGGCLLLAGGSTSTETGDKVSLNGRVLGPENRPIRDVVVELDGTGLKAITDTGGHYTLSGTLQPNEYAHELRYLLIGQVVTNRNVPGLVGEVPDVRMQTALHAITGSFTPGPHSIGRIEGLIRSEDPGITDSLRIQFHHEVTTSSFSGLADIPPGRLRPLFHVLRVRVFDPDGNLTGESENVYIESYMGYVVVPTFNPAGLIGPKRPAQ